MVSLTGPFKGTLGYSAPQRQEEDPPEEEEEASLSESSDLEDRSRAFELQRV